MSSEREVGPRRTSQYVTVCDGTRLAIDVWLPADVAERGPIGTVMRATRYWRAAVDAADTSLEAAEAELFTSRGLALVTVDVRGTGASFGTWTGPWSAEEIEDLGELVDWITAQPWSNGRVGAHGVSYDGNTAELLASTGRSAVVAVVPRFADHDPWAHLSFPGGVMLEGFLAQWAAGNAALDHDDTSLIASSADEAAELRAIYGHPRPVDDDHDRTLLAAAVAEHAGNLDVFSAGRAIEAYDDDASRSMGYPEVAPFSHRDEIDANGTHVLGVASWFDAGTAAGALARFCTARGPQQVLLGAWSHGGQFAADPLLGGDEPSPADPQVDEQRASVADWLAVRLADDVVATPRLIRYYVCGSREWRDTEVWPPHGVVSTRWHLSADGALAAGDPVAGERRWDVALGTSTGPANRWMTQAGGAPVSYGDRAEADDVLVHWTSDLLDADLEVTGTPVVTVDLASSTDDGLLLVYLEVVLPDGTVRMLSEGVLRLRHRATGDAPYVVQGPYHPCTSSSSAPMVPGVVERIELALSPIAARLPLGSRVRVAVAGHDEGTFTRVPTEGTSTFTFVCGSGSMLELPVLTAEEGGR